MGMNSHHPQPAEQARPAAARRHRSGTAAERRRSPLAYLVMALGMLSAVLLVQTNQTPVQAAPTNVLTLHVTSQRTEPRASVVKGDPITNFKYIINVDNTGTTEQNPYKAGSPTGCSKSDPGYPASCHWTSMGIASSAPIYTQGDQSDFGANGVATFPALPDGRYLISVLADGFKLDGVHFTMPMTDTDSVNVELQPTPLPTATIKAQIFEDSSPVNSAPDLPIEHGLQGFTGQIKDYLGQVITDVFGNPICTHYMEEVGGFSPDYIIDQNLLGPDYVPTPNPAYPGGQCLSDADGVLTFPNLGPNRYTLTATAPDGTNWVQTTTLEGNHDWDAWVMEGATGLDTEFTQGGEPFPAIFFGFVKPTTMPASAATGEIKGVVDGVHVYVPAKGGVGQTGQIFGGLTGTKIDKPIDKPWIALTALTGTPELDTAIYVGQGNSDGTFDIQNVPDGNYTLTWWDEPQNYILDLVNVSVANGEVVDMGILPINGWWSKIDGYVFNDDNRNGVRDPGEAGVPNFTLTMRKRENSLMDRGTTLVSTDADGYYSFEGAYPMTQWLVEEAYSDSYYTTGVTYQSDNQPDPTTVLGAGVDVSVLPIIGLSGTLDWGVHAYDATGATGGLDPRNGGIVGTISYDTTRNELDPRYAAVEDWQPGISGIPVELHQPVPCNTHPGTPCSTAAGPKYELAADGSYAQGALINTYVTETWGDSAPTGCIARDVDGNPLIAGVDENVLPGDNTGSPDDLCLEGPLMGNQFQTGFSNVDGNYGFGDGCFAPGVLDASDPANPTCTDSAGVDVPFTPLPASDYLVAVKMQNDALGRPEYKVTTEEDINIGNGDQFVPQVPPPACAGALHTVDVSTLGTDGYAAMSPVPGVTVPASTPVENATFVGIGGSPYEGQQKPLCDTKLVSLKNGKSIVPTFNYYTDVPLPGRFWGLIVDDLNFSSDPKSLLVGEKAGVPFAPVGVYDYSNKLVYTTESDYNGLWDVLMPSTNRINCPTPSGVCANLYRFVGNDPGAPGHLNLNYKPNYITIAAEFEALPGLIVPADLAPTQVGVNVQLPGGQISQVQCAQDPVQPQIYAITRPYGAPSNSTTYTLTGFGFGAPGGAAPQVLLDPATGTAAATPLPVVSWSNTQIVFRVPTTTTVGARNLHITAANGQKSVAGITFHVTGGSYVPTVFEVGPGKTYDPTSTNANGGIHAIQHAIDAANSAAHALVVVYPNLPDSVNPRNNPRGAYFENLIVTKPIKIQGVGPGGTNPVTGVTTPGAIIDASAFAGDSVIATDWYTTLDALPLNNAGTAWDGNQNVFDGAAITIFARSGTFATANTAGYAASIDGLDLRGGNQQGFPGNLNAIGGGATGLPANMITQGGAIFANAYATNLRITNNTVQNNGGAYGTIRLGTPDIPAPNTSNHNENVRIVNNRIIQNAGTNLAGAIGLFAGSDGYEVANNDICGNFSAEYGGGISAFGFSPNGKIHDNRVYFNSSYDEGGGIMVGGTLQANPALPSPGSGPVDIYNNLVQANLSNDDGGGIRFLMAGTSTMNVYNNIVVNNVSTHEGGGIALNDTPNARVFNNTIMKNITTATAVTSNGLPAPAGLSTSLNSGPLQASLPPGSLTYSNPLLFNNIFWDNRAGTRAGGSVTGIGAAPDTTVYNWDLGEADSGGAILLSPTNSVLQTTFGTIASPTNLVSNPNVVAMYDVGMSFQVWRNNPAFVGAIMATVDVPPNLMGDYHLPLSGSPAINAGAANKSGVAAPTSDIDGGVRPSGGGFEIGADELATAPTANLRITKNDGRANIPRGQSDTYTIVVTNPSAAVVANAVVVDTLPANLLGATWTCSGTLGSICPASGTGNINTTVTLGAGGTATFLVTGTVDPAAPVPGTLTNTATVAPPAGTIDPVLTNNTATDVDNITSNGPNWPQLDGFNRANANTLAPNWGQSTSLGIAALRVNSNQAYALVNGQAMWNPAAATFGPKQGAQITFANTVVNNTSLILKATGGTASSPSKFIRVRYQTNTGGIVVSTTVNSGNTYTQQGAVLPVVLASGDRLGVIVDSAGLVSIYKTTGTTTTLVGTRQVPTSGLSSFVGSGRIGIQLPTGGRIDNFSGGTMP